MYKVMIIDDEGHSKPVKKYYRERKRGCRSGWRLQAV